MNINRDTVECKNLTTSSSSIKRVSPSTMQEAICLLRKQLRQCKMQRQGQRQSYRQQEQRHAKQIQSLRQKILHMNEKQYLKTVLAEESQEQRLQKQSLSTNYKRLRLYAQKLESDLEMKNKQLQRLQEEKLDLNRDKQTLQKQKQKHLELSIVEKINLEQRIELLEKQIQSKQNMLNALRSQGVDSTNNQIRLKKLERKLLRKLNQLEHYENQAKNLKSFQVEKLNKRLQSLQRQNQFLKNHINKIQSQFQQINQCSCSNNECKKQIDLFKNKYINKSRELSKVKIELSKQMFKEQFLKDIKNKQNLSPEELIKTKNRLRKSREKVIRFQKSDGLKQSNNSYGRIEEDKDDMLLFRLTQNDQEYFREQNYAPSYSQK